MKILVTFIFSVLVVTNLILSTTSAMDETKPVEIWWQANYELLTSLKSIPKPVLDEIIKKMPYDPRLADRGEKFRATDVIVDETIPCRRFVMGGRSAQFVFICYEHGGYGLHKHLAVFDTTGTHPELIFATTYLEEARTIDEIKNLARKDEFKNQIGNVHQEW